MVEAKAAEEAARVIAEEEAAAEATAAEEAERVKAEAADKAARIQWADQLMENHAYEIDRRWVDRTNVGTTILMQDYGDASRRVQAASRMTVEEIKAVEDKLKFKEVEAYGSWQQVRSSSRSDIALIG